MKIRKCPHCVQYIHFDCEVGTRRCWHCGRLTDFAKRKSLEENFALLPDARLSVFLSSLLGFVASGNRKEAVLLAALPIAVIMLLVCNSLQISVVHDPTAPFTKP